MANLTKLLLITVAITIVLTMTGAAEIPGNAVYNLLTNPGSWGTSSMIDVINNLMTLVGGTLVIVGTLLPGRHDLMVFAGLSAVFLSFGVGFIELFNIIQAESEEILGGGGTWIATIFTAPLVTTYFMTVLSFWRSRAD